MIRRAKIEDVPEMIKLINLYAQKGQMLGRPLIELYDSIRNFVVAEADGLIDAFTALIRSPPGDGCASSPLR